MLDHMGFRVRDLVAARRFYDACTAPLGLATIDNTAESFLVVRTPEHQTSSAPIHFAFTAKDRAAVNAFYAAALKAGGVDSGAPGPRGGDGYGYGYYAAFALDPDGNNVEAGVRE